MSADVAEGYGPAIMSTVTINAPGRICHGRRGMVVAVWLATNEMTVQLGEGTQHILPWDAAVARGALEHGTRGRYRAGCRCIECMDANTKYTREWRHAQASR